MTKASTQWDGNNEGENDEAAKALLVTMLRAADKAD
jgi:hypothetical protein